MGPTKTKKEALHDEALELDHLYQTAPVGLCLLDRNLRYLRINELLKLPAAHCALEGPSYVIHVVRPKKKQTVYEAVYLGPGRPAPRLHQGQQLHSN